MYKSNTLERKTSSPSEVCSVSVFLLSAECDNH